MSDTLDPIKAIEGGNVAPAEEWNLQKSRDEALATYTKKKNHNSEPGRFNPWEPKDE